MSVYRCVCPFLCTYQHGSHWTDTCETWYRRILWKFVNKFRVLLKSNKIYEGGKGNLHEDLSTFCFCGQNKFPTKVLICDTQYFEMLTVTGHHTTCFLIAVRVYERERNVHCLTDTLLILSKFCLFSNWCTSELS